MFNGETVSRGGDLIVAIDGQAVRSADDIVRQVAARLPGESASLTIVRAVKAGRGVRLGEAARGARDESLRHMHLVRKRAPG